MPTPETSTAPTGQDRGPATWAVQGVPLAEIAERFGTPVCVYDADELRRQWQTWRTAHPEPLESAYILSANPNVSLAATVRTWCAGAVVTTHTELTSALLSGYAADTIVLDGPLGAPGLVGAALRAGIGAFAVTDVEQAGLLDDAAAMAGRRTDVVARIDPARRGDADAFLTDLLLHPFEQVCVTGVCLPKGAVTADAVRTVSELLERLDQVALHERLVVLQPDSAHESERATQLTAAGRVVVASGHPQVGAASSLLVRVVRTGRAGSGPATMDCPLPPNAEIHALGTDLDSADDGSATARIGDLFVAPGLSLLDLPLPIGHVLSHGVPAEVLVIDGRAVSIRSAATTEYLLSRQSALPSTT